MRNLNPPNPNPTPPHPLGRDYHQICPQPHGCARIKSAFLGSAEITSRHHSARSERPALPGDALNVLDICRDLCRPRSRRNAYCQTTRFILPAAPLFSICQQSVQWPECESISHYLESHRWEIILGVPHLTTSSAFQTGTSLPTPPTTIGCIDSPLGSTHNGGVGNGSHRHLPHVGSFVLTGPQCPDPNILSPRRQY